MEIIKENKNPHNFVAKKFDYTMVIGDDQIDKHAAVIVIPDGMKWDDGSRGELTIYPHDKDDNLLDFATVEDAQDWIDTYGDKVKFKVENRNEVHAHILDTFDEWIKEFDPSDLFVVVFGNGDDIKVSEMLPKTEAEELCNKYKDKYEVAEVHAADSIKLELDKE